MLILLASVLIFYLSVKGIILEISDFDRDLTEVDMMTKANNSRGYVLILTVGILGILTLICLAVVVNARLGHAIASNYINGAKATYLAEAGINDAISRLKVDGKVNFIYTGSISNYSDGTLCVNRGFYSVDIEDEQRKINIDKVNRNLLKSLLGDGDYTRADAIISARPFETKEQIMRAAGIDDAVYQSIKNDITIYSYRDPNTINSAGGSEARCPININTASKEVLKAVLEGVINGPRADSLADEIIAERQTNSFDSWSKFDNFINMVTTTPPLNSSDRDNIKSNANPNRLKPSPYTTDFCFHSGGKYTLTSTGILYATSLKIRIIAEKKIEAVVDIYGIENQTKKSDFQGSDGAVLPIAWKVTALNNCPVRGDQQTLYDSGSSAFETIPDSIKIGFWDDFDEGGQNALFFMNNTSWAKRGTGSADGNVWGGALYSITDADLRPGADKELELTTGSYWSPVWLESSSPSSGMTWTDFSYSLQEDSVSSCRARGAPPWYVAFPAYRTTLASGIKDETWWRHLHFTSHERWYPWHSSFATIWPNYYWWTVMRVKFVCDGSTVKYYFRNNSHSLKGSFRTDNVGGVISGAVGFWGWGVQARFDNIRIIPKSPDGNGDYAHFVSTELPTAAFDSDVEWGAVWGTVTIPSSASSATEKVYFQLSTDGGLNWSPAEPGLETQGAVNLTGTQIQYKANFEIDPNQSYPGDRWYWYNPGDQQFRETPVLEDVYITYLPPTRVLYWRNL